jgi:predicted DNA-binding ribbon-helix-helix protein
MNRHPAPSPLLPVERVQTGVRLEKRLLKVLKALAEYHDISLGDLLEGIVLHAFEGKPPFGEESRARIADLKRVYHLDLDATASHRLVEAAEPERARSARRRKKE